MADVLSILRTLVHKDDVRHWAAVNHTELVEKGDTFYVGDCVITFDENERVSGVEQRPAERPQSL